MSTPSDPAERFAALRARHPELVYERFEIVEEADGWRFDFHFTLANGPRFQPFLFVPKKPGAPPPDRALLENLAFHAGLAESISYWKAACPPVLRIEAGDLSPEQTAWWRDLFYHGLGEFFYLNGLISVVDRASFVSFAVKEGGPGPIACPAEGNLVPVGGGKDSLVTLDLLAPFHAETDCFFLNPSRAREEGAALFGYGPEKTIVARRRLDPALMELNRAGYWNGHTPFSALLGFSAVLAAVLWGKRRVVLSNEASASEPTVPGTEINHQYSKSWDYERAFSAYVARWLTPSVSYFSLLRPWNELQIARRFAREERALSVFRSCNVGSAKDLWCGECPKCLFVDVLLLPFLSHERRAAVFGPATPLDKPALLPILEELAGVAPVKPFECVGTTEEVLAALALAGERPPLAAAFLETHAARLPDHALAEALLSGFHGPHQVPDSFLPLLG
ncbi:MAG: hypothetical protein PW734_00440 [Verrucomicrobium sp.]|nr:hypothetical protein [Verrucomicrobium sp.]